MESIQACSSTQGCACPNKTCNNNGRCCDCVASHRSSHHPTNPDFMPYCMRIIAAAAQDKGMA